MKVLRIVPSTGWVSLGLAELVQYRDLVFFLAWRDVKVRYKQTALGAAWAVLQPLMTMVVFSIFFGRLAKVGSDGMPYPVFSLCALVPWTLFAHALNESANSLVASSNLLKKVYFPRLIIPLSTVLSGLVDFGIAFAMLVGLMAWYGIVPGLAVLWLPAFVLLAIVTAIGTGLWLSALNVRYRDVRYTMGFLVQFWLFCTPIAYPSSLVPAGWKRTLYGLNPMTGVVEGFRWALLGTGSGPNATLAVSTAVAFVILLTGALYFRRMERTFADVV